MHRALWLAIGARQVAQHPAPAAVPTPAPPSDASLATQLDHEMMLLALEQAARAAKMGEVPVGAVVYHTESGKVLARAHNRREADNDPAAHAEHIAMTEACRARGDWRLSDCSLAVTLEPCCMCAGLVVNSRVGRLVYGARDPKAGAAGSLYSLTDDPRLNHRVTPIAGVYGTESGALLSGFFRGLRKKKSKRA